MSKDENGNPKRTLFTQILPYDVIGELSLLYDQKRTATAIADEDSELLVLEKKLLNTILKVNSPFSFQTLFYFKGR